MPARAFRTALTYALLAGLWIFALDLAFDYIGGRAFWPGHLLLIISSLVLLYLAFWRDLRAREQAEARLADLVDSAVDGIVAVDEEQRIFLFNQGAQRVFGYRPEEVLGQKLDLLLPQRYVASHHVRLDDLIRAPEPLNTAGHSGPAIFGRRKDGSEFPAEASLSASNLQGRRVFTAIVHDISRRREAEEALQRAHDELEQRVVERTEALTRANSALEAENAERRRAEAAGERERQRAEALARTLQAERDTLDAIMEHTRAHLAYLDSQLNFVLVNDTYCRGAGYSREALIGRNHFELFPHPENQAIFERVRDTGQPFEVLGKPFEFPDQPERGVTYWDWTLTPVAGDGGHVHGVVLSLVDVTGARRMAEELRQARDGLERRVQERTVELAQANAALQHSLEEQQAQNEALATAQSTLAAERRRYQELFESAPDGYVVTDASGVVLEVNSAAGRLLNVRPEGLLGKPLSLYLTHAESHTFFAHLAGLQEQAPGEAAHWETALQPRGRPPFPAVVAAAAVRDLDGCPTSVRWLLHDISERKLMEGELRASEELFRQLAENVREVFWVASADWSQMSYVSPAYESLWGYPRDSLYREPRSFTRAVAPEDLSRVAALFQKANSDVEFQITRPDDSTRWVRARGFPIQDQAGDVYRIVGIAEDITDRVEAYQLLEQRVRERTSELDQAIKALQVEVADRLRVEAELEAMVGEHDRQRQQAQELAALAQFRADELAAVFAAISDPVVALDAQGHVMRINPAAQAATSALPIQRSNGNGQAPVAVYASNRQMVPWDDLPPARALRGETVTAERLLLIGRDGQEVSILASASPLYRGDVVSGAVVVWHYLTEHERLRALEERQHLARELHDSLTQVLYGISLGAHTARTWLDTNRAKVLEALDYIISLGETGLSEMRALIFDLRPEALEAEGLVKALSKRAAAVQARFELQVVTDLCPEPDVPLAAKEVVYRIAQEMLHNAVRHAFARRLELKLACDEHGLLLSLADDGVGFDPSQTFTGHLGLHSMKERAQFLGGSFHVDSAPGRGTHVELRLPRSREVARS